MERRRLAAGLTVTDVAARLTRTPLTVQRWEQGKHTPPRDCLTAMASLYGCHPGDLVAA